MAEEWRIARSRRRRTQGHRPLGTGPSAPPTGDALTLAELDTAHRSMCLTVEAEASFSRLQRALASLPVTSPDTLDCICLGLGSPSDSRCSRVQVALLHRLADASPLLESTRLTFYDPAFTRTDVEFLTRRFGSGAVLRTNDEGQIVCDRPSLFFLPHCPLPLLNNLLFANWTPANLSNLFILGNRLNETLDAAAASGSDLTPLCFVRAAVQLLQEVMVEWDGPLMSAMACTSLQWLSPLPPPSDPIWLLKTPSPPDYSGADVGELIRA